MRPADIQKSIKELKLKAGSDLDHRVHGEIDRALADTTHTVHSEPSIRRTIVKSPISKLAAAAIIVIAVVLGLSPFFRGTVTFAKVIKPLLNYDTIMFDFIVGEEGSSPVIHDIIKGNRIRRTISNVDSIMILDLDNARMLTLQPQSRDALYVDTQGIVNQGTKQLLDMMRNIVSQVDENPEIVTQKLGRRDFDGVETIGFQLKEPKVTINLWADPVTATPKRIELTIGQSTSILKNIEFDIPVSDDEVSMEVPEGYTQKQQSMVLSDATEEDLVITLGLWAEHILDGVFPDEISAQELLKLQPDLIKALGQMEGSEQELTELGMHYGRTMVFLSMLGQQGEWHYAGKGVAFGDSETAIFWYRRGEAKTYRVIYGALHVEEVGLDHFPQ